MMTDAQSAQTALDKLIEAVKAGKIAEYTRDTGLNIDALILVEKSLTGSLDAALALHEALLPGWRARLDIGRRRRCWMISPDNQKLDAYAPTPARAWLLAVLKAYRETK